MPSTCVPKTSATNTASPSSSQPVIIVCRRGDAVEGRGRWRPRSSPCVNRAPDRSPARVRNAQGTIVRTSIGAAMKTMISAWMMAMRSMLTPAATCICRPPAWSAPNRMPASSTPTGMRAAEQGHGDRVEADAGGEVGRGAAEHAEHLVGAGEAGERAGAAP